VRLSLERAAVAEAELSAHAETLARAVADTERTITLAHEAEKQGLVKAHETEKQGLVKAHEEERQGLVEQMQLLQSEVIRDTEKTQSQVVCSSLYGRCKYRNGLICIVAAALFSD
jgi:adenylate kinase